MVELRTRRGQRQRGGAGRVGAGRGAPLPPGHGGALRGRRPAAGPAAAWAGAGAAAGSCDERCPPREYGHSRVQKEDAEERGHVVGGG